MDDLVENQQQEAPPAAAKKPNGLMGFNGRSPNDQESTASPTALPAIPRAKVGKGLEGSRTGKTTRANSPAKLPKPIQISTTLAQCWATWENSRSDMRQGKGEGEGARPEGDSPISSDEHWDSPQLFFVDATCMSLTLLTSKGYRRATRSALDANNARRRPPNVSRRVAHGRERPASGLLHPQQTKRDDVQR